MVFSLDRFQRRHGGQRFDVSRDLGIFIEPSPDAWIHEPLSEQGQQDGLARFLVKTEAGEQDDGVPVGDFQLEHAIGIEAKPKLQITGRFFLPDADAARPKLSLDDDGDHGRIVTENTQIALDAIIQLPKPPSVTVAPATPLPSHARSDVRFGSNLNSRFEIALAA